MMPCRPPEHDIDDEPECAGQHEGDAQEGRLDEPVGAPHHPVLLAAVGTERRCRLTGSETHAVVAACDEHESAI